MNVLVIAPHPDDEVLGCGGTIAKHAACGDDVYVVVVTKGCEPIFSSEGTEFTRDECRKADMSLGVKETIFLEEFPAAMIETVDRYKLNDALIDVIQRVKPDTVYIPHRGDMQLDHKLVVDAAMVALRPKYDHVVKNIYAYEVLSETGWDLPNMVNDFIPNRYVDISEYGEKKCEALKMFSGQVQVFPDARSVEAVKALYTYRGAMMGMNAAEAFEVVRELA